MLERHLRVPYVLVLASTLALSSCSSLKVTVLGANARKPSNVAFYVTIERSEEPVPGLGADRFAIYEDGARLSPADTKLTMIDPSLVVGRYTLILLDLSAKVVESDRLGDIAAGATKLVERTLKTDKVAVGAFDGSAQLHVITHFADKQPTIGASLEKIPTFKPSDPSSNLHGGVVEGLRALDKALSADARQFKVGTLIVFVGGPDRAGRVSWAQMREAVDAAHKKGIHVFALGAGPAVADVQLEQIGKTFTVREKASGIGRAFELSGARASLLAQRHYVLSYCTPARAGKHSVRIDVRDDKGTTGSFSYRFDADGFGPNCDPGLPPDFEPELEPIKGETPKPKPEKKP